MKLNASGIIPISDTSFPTFKTSYDPPKKQLTYQQIVNTYENISPDYSRITSEELDLNNGRSTNIFPYRGQFSPDLIKGLLNHFSENGNLILDPFVGCGTTLFEAAKKGLSAYGIEINPAAVEMARTTIFINLSLEERNKLIEKVLEMVGDLPQFSGATSLNVNDIHVFIEELLLSNKHNDYLYNILANGYIRFLNGMRGNSLEDYRRTIKQHAQIIRELPISKGRYEVFLSDSRNIRLSNNEIDLVITSPPYVNVFNYHQHNRKYIDSIYGNALHVAKSEFGANRKHRQNRFLTVTQYILDMTEAFLEIKRVLKKTGRIIIVVGKTTKVKGIDFRNDYIIAGVGHLSGYKLVNKQERKFLNLFGQVIYEELLHFIPSEDTNYSKHEGIAFAKDILNASLEKTSKEETEKDLNDAIDRSDTINPSPLFKQNENTAFRKN